MDGCTLTKIMSSFTHYNTKNSLTSTNSTLNKKHSFDRLNSVGMDIQEDNDINDINRGAKINSETYNKYCNGMANMTSKLYGISQSKFKFEDDDDDDDEEEDEDDDYDVYNYKLPQTSTTPIGKKKRKRRPGKRKRCKEQLIKTRQNSLLKKENEDTIKNNCSFLKNFCVTVDDFCTTSEENDWDVWDGVTTEEEDDKKEYDEVDKKNNCKLHNDKDNNNLIQGMFSMSLKFNDEPTTTRSNGGGGKHINDDSPSSSRRHVRFATGPSFIVIHEFELQPFETPDWGLRVLDNIRFQDKIIKFNQLLSPYLTKEYRSMVYKRLYGGNDDDKDENINKN